MTMAWRIGMARQMMQLCHKFGGNMFVIKDESTRETAVDVKQIQNKCNDPWGNFKLNGTIPIQMSIYKLSNHCYFDF